MLNFLNHSIFDVHIQEYPLELAKDEKLLDKIL